MKIIVYPDKERWGRLCKRPAFDNNDISNSISDVLKGVKEKGDQAIREFSVRFDGVDLDRFEVGEEEIDASVYRVPENVKTAVEVAKSNIEKFHRSQAVFERIVETRKGVHCWRRSVPIERVGLYIPGGNAPLFSSLMMLAIPAKIAGCKEIIVATPPEKNGRVNPNILYTAHLLGLKKIFKIGGAQAIAAMAYGTESIPNVYKIFGPGNRFVTKAKELVQLDGVPIDMPAGPSEVLIVADESSNPRFVAADLLSQAEHGPDSQAVLLSNTENLVEEVMIEIEKQIRDLPRRDLAAQSIENSFALVLKDIRECIDFSNMYAPEHLILAVTSPRSYSDYIVNAGSVFLGEYSCESLGDYASGTNHTLPTNGFARSFSGVSVDSFVKKITFQEISVEGLMNIGPAVEVLAEAENLAGHKNAVSLRLKGLNRD